VSGTHRLSDVESTQVLAAVRAAVNEAAASLRKLRQWCDDSEAAARSEDLCFRDCPARFEARMELIEEVRSLLPPIPEAAEGVDMDGTRVTPGEDREYFHGGTDSGN
jgi:hypothetical protein